MKLRLIVNPSAGAGAAGRRLPAIERALERAGIDRTVALTRRPGDATRLVREAAADGVEVAAIVGGDGTVNEAAQAYLDDEGKPRPGPDLALIPCGTGGDFRKTFELGKGVEEAVARIRRAAPRLIDLGVLEVRAASGETQHKAFLNIASFGISGVIDRIVNASPKWMGGRTAFFVGTLRAMAAYRNAPVRITLDGDEWLTGRIATVALANGRFFGGGMEIAPGADPSDGLIDVVALGDLSRAESLGLTSKIYRGAHLSHPKVRHAQARSVQAEPLDTKSRVFVDLDGEMPGSLPIKATLAAGALRVRA